ncbi:hypothetical protein K443DRAFT_115285, partial [Laccaria amethystina LaAM-08-1]
AQRAAEGVVLDFRFPVRRNARVSVGLSDKNNFCSAQYAHNLSELGVTTLLRFTSAISDGGHNERNVHPCGACSSVRPLHDDHFIFEGIFHSYYREFTFNHCNVDLGLVEFVFDPHSTSDSATSNLTPSSSAH